MLGMRQLLDRVSEALAQERQRQSQKLDEKRTRKALRKSLPGVPVIYTKAYGRQEVGLLLAAGWSIVDKSGGDLLDKIAGTQGSVVTTMSKPNPETTG